MDRTLDDYENTVGPGVIRQLRTLGSRLSGARVVHVNSTRSGGGVAEILEWMIPLMRDLGLDAVWHTIDGDGQFFEITKTIHNGLQGQSCVLSKRQWEYYRDVNRANAERLSDVLTNADFVIIHDPQPAFLRHCIPDSKGKWVWRAHIDLSHPDHELWRELKSIVQPYHASIYSLPEFARWLSHTQVIVAPSIDPLSEKNRDVTPSEMDSVRNAYDLDPARPLMVQISRFDRFKDPIGVIKAFQMVRRRIPAQLVLAGGGATDDPEGQQMLTSVTEAANGDPDIRVLMLPSDANHTVNVLQRLADIVIQKSTKEGFGLTVTEALWKSKPVIGGDTGGIRLQVINYHTGFLVSTPEGAAHRLLYLLHFRDMISKMGEIGHEFVKTNFLLTRHLREYLTLLLALKSGDGGRILYV